MGRSAALRPFSCTLKTMGNIGPLVHQELFAKRRSTEYRRFGVRGLMLPLLLLALAMVQAQSSSAKQQGSTPSSAKQQGASSTTPKKSPLVAYAGNWIGTFEGKPWMILNLSLVGEQFSGSLQRASRIDFNDNGELKHVSEEFVAEPLVDGKLNPDGLVLTVRNADTQETSRYLMKLTSESTAQIKMIEMTMPPGMPKPKPWKLTKAPATAPQKQ
jgi:hypothetical protein